MNKALQDVGSALAQLAPTIAGLFLGPLGATGAQVAEQALGIAPKADATTDQRKQSVLEALLGATPEQLMALKQADNDLKQKLVDGGVQLEQIAASDRASARQMQMSTNSYMTPIIAALVIIGAIVGEWWAMTRVIPPGSEVITGRVLGTLDAALMLVLSFYFGSSAGSSDKNKLLDKAISAVSQS